MTSTDINASIVDAPTTTEEPPRKLFILHAEDADDVAFVKKRLLPALGLPQERYKISSEPELGRLIIEELQEGVLSSFVTVAIMSPAFLSQSWSRFGNALALHHAASGGRLVPLLREPCKVPLASCVYTTLDFTDQGKEEEELARLRRFLDQPEPVSRPLPCPYPGPRPYQDEDKAYFAGRDEQIQELVQLIAGGARELYLLGASGSGKTSLIRAGVAAHLRCTSDAAVGQPFTVHYVDSRDRAPQQLAEFKAQITSSSLRSLVVIDPLETIFLEAPAEERTSFLQLLGQLREEPRCHLLFAMRSDHTAALFASELAAHARAAHRIDLPPLRHEELREAIAVPAMAVGGVLAPTLVEWLRGEVEGQPGALALLQETLVTLWSKSRSEYIDVGAYAVLRGTNTSGLAATARRRAEIAFHALRLSDQPLVHRILSRLTPDGGGGGMIRGKPRSYLHGDEAGSQLERVLSHLISHRLVVSDGDVDHEPTYELAHRGLSAAWPALGTWMSEHFTDERRRDKLYQRALDWSGQLQKGNKTAGVLDADELEEYDRWCTPEVRAAIGLGELICAFLEASRAHLASSIADRDAKEAELRRRLGRYYLAKAQDHLQGARGAKAVPYLDAARALGADGTTLEALFHWAWRALPVGTAEGRARWVSWGPDRSRLAIAYDESIQIWDIDRSTKLKLRGSSQPMENPRWTADGRQFAAHHPRSGEAKTWDVQTGEATVLRNETSWYESSSEVPPRNPRSRSKAGHLPELRKLSPDGTKLVEAGDYTARIFRREGEWPASPLFEHPAPVTAVEWSSDSERLATLAGEVYVWDAHDPASRHLASRSTAALPTQRAVTPLAPLTSPDKLLLAEAQGKRVQIYRNRDREPAAPIIEHKAEIVAMSWSPESRRLAVASIDRALRVWDASAGYVLSSEIQLQGDLQSLAWEHQELLVATLADGTEQTWPTPCHQVSPDQQRQALQRCGYRMSSDGALIATYSTAGG